MARVLRQLKKYNASTMEDLSGEERGQAHQNLATALDAFARTFARSAPRRLAKNSGVSCSSISADVSGGSNERRPPVVRGIAARTLDRSSLSRVPKNSDVNSGRISDDVRTTSPVCVARSASRWGRKR